MKNIIMSGIIVMSMSAILQADIAKMNVCLSCHGQTFEKVALNKSKIVKDMSVEDIKAALDGYKDGTYGGPMKGLMKAQVKDVKNTERASQHIYAVANGKEWPPAGMEKGKGKPGQKGKSGMGKKKEKCKRKVEEISKCVDNAKSPEDMGICKKQIIDLAEHVKSTIKK